MIDQAIQRLQYLHKTIPAQLAKVTEENFSFKQAPEKWSKKEILGHLLDSATNNHHRFVRAQFEDTPLISYDQNKWNEASRYQQMDTRHLIAFWALYNFHLLEVLKRIPENVLRRECLVGVDKKVTLDWIINDYVRHLEHHLKQIVDYV